MGPLSVKSQIQARAGHVKDQMTVIKTLSDEARKKDLHRIKMAKEIAKAKAEGFDIEDTLSGFSDGTLELPVGGVPQPNTIKGNNKGTNQPTKTLGIPPVNHGIIPPVTLNNPEAGPSDTIPAMLTPGEAVIPASVAQDSAYKPVIEALVNEGRMRNRQPGGVKGFADGTLGDDDVMRYESGGNPLAKNPKSSATGLYQMIGAARKDVEAFRPDLKGKDFSDPKVQAEYRDTYKGILSTRLQQSGIEPNEDNINKAWVVGAGGLKKIASNPDVPLSATLGEGVTKINPNLQGKTGAKFLSDPNPYSRKGVSPVPTSEAPSSVVPKPAVHRRGGTSGYMRDLAQSQKNPVYEAELAKMAAEGSPEDQSIAKAEMARLQRAVSVPPIQTPDGAIPKVKASVPEPSPKTPDGFSMTPAVEKKAEVTPTEVAKAPQLEATMAAPEVKIQLTQLQQTKPPEGADPKDWLAKGLAKIFGPTGMFNDEDLIRFSLLAAGGMLTGGSTGGSLRYAGLHTLKQSDERRQAQAAAAAKQAEIIRQGQVEAAKDVRERNQSLENTYHDKLDKASPEARTRALKLFEESRAPGSHPAVREAKLQQAIQLLAANQVNSSKDGKPRAPVSGYNSKTGEELQYFWDDNNNMLVRDPKSGGFVDAAKAGLSVMSTSEFNKQEKSQRDSVDARLTGRLLAMNKRPDGSDIDKNYNESAAKAHAAQLTEEVMSLRRDLGFDVKPEDFSKIVDNTIANLQENYRGRKINEITPEALRKVVYGSAVISMRPTNKPLYEVEKADGKPGRPGEEALFNYGNAIQKAISEGKAQGAQLTPEKVSAHWEEQFKKLPKKMQETFEIKARATPGYSPYLLWVKENTVNR